MNKTLMSIAAAAFVAMSAHAGDNVPGNCGKGSGHGNACLPEPTPVPPPTKHPRGPSKGGNDVDNQSRSRASSQSSSSSRSAASSKAGASVGDVSSSATNSGNNSSNMATNSGNNTTIDVPRAPVNTAYAAGLTVSNGSCMGSSSGGLQVSTFGISGGKTWDDKDCNRRYNAIVLVALDRVEAGVALMCQNPEVEAAMMAAGTPCPMMPKVAVASPQYTDPIIRQRLGLPSIR